MWYKILPVILLFSCSASRKATTENDNSMTRLHDIWALESMNGESLPSDLSKMPVLEIFVEENNIVGNDGCNNISGSIKKITNEELVFGQIMGTKMACPNMVFSRKFGSNLSSTRFYVLKGLSLVLLDENKTELMVFKKVD